MLLGTRLTLAFTPLPGRAGVNYTTAVTAGVMAQGGWQLGVRSQSLKEEPGARSQDLKQESGVKNRNQAPSGI